MTDVGSISNNLPLPAWQEKLRAPFVDKTTEEVQLVAINLLKDVFDLKNPEPFIKKAHKIAAGVFSERDARLAKAHTWQAEAKKVLAFFLAGFLFVTTIVGCIPLIYLIRKERRKFNQQIQSLTNIGTSYAEATAKNVDTYAVQFRAQVLGKSVQYVRSVEEVAKELTHKKRSGQLFVVDNQEISVPDLIHKDILRAPKIEFFFGEEVIQFQPQQNKDIGQFYRALFDKIKVYEPDIEKAYNIFDNILALLTQDLWAAEAEFLRQERHAAIQYNSSNTAHVRDVTQKEFEEHFDKKDLPAATYRVKMEAGVIKLTSLRVFKVEEFDEHARAMTNTKFRVVGLERTLPRSVLQTGPEAFGLDDFQDVRQTALHSPEFETLDQSLEYMQACTLLLDRNHLIDKGEADFELGLLKKQKQLLATRIVEPFNKGGEQEFHTVLENLRGDYANLKLDSSGYEKQFGKDVRRSTFYSISDRRYTSRVPEEQTKALKEQLGEHDSPQWEYALQYAVSQGPRNNTAGGPGAMLVGKQGSDPEFEAIFEVFALKWSDDLPITKLEVQRDGENKITSLKVTAQSVLNICAVVGSKNVFLQKGAIFEMQHEVTLGKDKNGHDQFQVALTHHRAVLSDPIQELFAKLKQEKPAQE